MKANQILDAFSETLMRDDRILCSRERELLTSLLQNAKAVCGSNAETQDAVNAAISRSVGETVAQRAFALLGGSIVEQILAHPEISRNAERNPHFTRTELHSPQPPGGPQDSPVSPQPPTSSPQPPSPSQPGRTPQPPTSSQLTQSLRALRVQPGACAGTADSGNGVGVLEAPATAASQCVVLDEFLAPQELEEVVAYTLQHEADFRASEVISPSGDPGVIDYNHRRSQVLMDLGKHQHVIVERILSALPSVLEQLAIEEFPVGQIEAQITASSDGDFFGVHSDDGQETIATRRLTFVYFFHCDPSPFQGGELRLYDSSANDQRRRNSSQAAGYQAGACQSIAPQQNQIVFFPCSVMHEITPVNCSSRSFADSRFTLNGWLHQ